MTLRKSRPVVVTTDGVTLPGYLDLPVRPAGMVVFAHGGGSGRDSPRNRFVADALREAGFGILLFDLITREEAEDRETPFDIGFLAGRLQGARRWVSDHAATRGVPVGYYGSSSGAAAALVAAQDDRTIQAIVSRGARPDLAGRALPRVRAPTLLIVGGNDTVGLEENETAYHLLECEKAFEIVPGATHLFEEPGALEVVARLSVAWFQRHLEAKVRDVTCAGIEPRPHGVVPAAGHAPRA